MKATRCSVDRCERSVYARAVCRSDYDKMRRRGEIPPVPPPAERLLARLVRMPNGCLEWTGAVDGDGYGNIRVNSKNMLTHRFAWELANGAIPFGLGVLHHCDNPPCCDVEKCLFLGTQTDNAADMIAKGRCHNQNVTHCPADHPYDTTNTYVYPDGRRRCRICSRAENISRRRRRRQEALSR